MIRLRARIEWPKRQAEPFTGVQRHSRSTDHSESLVRDHLHGLSLARLRAAGLSTEETDMVKEVMRITAGAGARVAFDSIGGPNFPKFISALAFQGVVYIYGALGDGMTPIPVLEMIAKMPTLKAHNIWLTSGNPVRQKPPWNTF